MPKKEKIPATGKRLRIQSGNAYAKQGGVLGSNKSTNPNITIDKVIANRNKKHNA